MLHSQKWKWRRPKPESPVSTDAIANLHACVGEGEAAIFQAVSVTR
jgi:hypothetical protein